MHACKKNEKKAGKQGDRWASSQARGVQAGRQAMRDIQARSQAGRKASR